jgi:hypothetical protein
MLIVIGRVLDLLLVLNLMIRQKDVCGMEEGKGGCFGSNLGGARVSEMIVNKTEAGENSSV